LRLREPLLFVRQFHFKSCNAIRRGNPALHGVLLIPVNGCPLHGLKQLEVLAKYAGRHKKNCLSIANWLFYNNLNPGLLVP